MTHLLRTDGEYTIYIIEYQYKNGEWLDAHGTFYELNDGGKPREEQRNGLTACGDCWQKLGVHGTFDFEYAQELANDIRENGWARKRYEVINFASTDGKIHVRIRKVEIKQKSSYLVGDCESCGGSGRRWI